MSESDNNKIIAKLSTYNANEHTTTNSMLRPDSDNNILFKNFIHAALVGGLGIKYDQVFGTNGIYDQLLQRYDDNTKFEMMGDTKLLTLLQNDAEIKKLEENGGTLHQYMSDTNIKTLWDSFKVNLGKLQGLAILRKIRTNNCKPVVEAIITAFDTKIKTVNNILRANLDDESSVVAGAVAGQSGGANEDLYKYKYFKYKLKYELLKESKKN